MYQGTHVYVKDLNTGTLTLASSPVDGTQGNGFSQISLPLFRRWKTSRFSVYADNLVQNDTNGLYDIFVKDLSTNELSNIHWCEQIDEQAYLADMGSDGSKDNF